MLLRPSFAITALFLRESFHGEPACQPSQDLRSRTLTVSGGGEKTQWSVNTVDVIDGIEFIPVLGVDIGVARFCWGKRGGHGPLARSVFLKDIRHKRLQECLRIVGLKEEPQKALFDEESVKALRQAVAEELGHDDVELVVGTGAARTGRALARRWLELALGPVVSTMARLSLQAHLRTVSSCMPVPLPDHSS